MTAQGQSREMSEASRSTATKLWLGLVFALVAGWLDAVGFIEVGQFYLSFMSGNTTQLGVAAAAFDGPSILRGASVIASFFLGAFFGTLLADASGRLRLPVVLMMECALLGAAIGLTLMRPGFFALLPISVAMGMQNTLRQLVGRADVGKSFVTGSLFGAGQSLARALTGKAPAAEWLAFLAAWLAFVAGAAGGAYALHRSSLIANLACMTALLAVLAALTAPARGVGNDLDAAG